jgi:hypothetical protein
MKLSSEGASRVGCDEVNPTSPLGVLTNSLTTLEGSLALAISKALAKRKMIDFSFISPNVFC